MSDAEPVLTVPLYQGGTGPERDAFLKRISELQRFDEQGARAIVAEVIKAGFSDLAVETLIKPLADALGVSIPAAKKFWKDAACAARDAAAAEAVRRAAEQRAESERESVEQRQAAAADERDRLWSSCRQIAESPTLLADMERLVHELGVVGEGPSIRGAYLAASSRLCRQSALCLLRRGAAAGGKNFLVSKALRLIAAQESLGRFVRDGWCDQAALLGWTADELYRIPPLWSRVDLTGAALLVGERRIVALTEASIVIETLSGSRLKFRRIGREHLA